MPASRKPRRHLRHEDAELVLRSTLEAAVQQAFRAGEDVGRDDGVAAERARAAAILAVAEQLNVVPLAISLLDTGLPAERAIRALRAAPPAPSCQ